MPAYTVYITDKNLENNHTAQKESLSISLQMQSMKLRIFLFENSGLHLIEKQTNLVAETESAPLSMMFFI